MPHPTPHKHGREEPLVQLTGLTCGYEGRVALSDVTLTIMPGDFLGLLGPSGSGKTTLLRSILGVVDVYQGQVLVEGISPEKRRPRAGYVPQLETIDWSFPVTVQEAVMMGHTMSNPFLPWHRRSDVRVAAEIMDRLGIGHLAQRHISELSGGQQQRVFLARALVSSPRLLLLDEPTAGVDIKTRDDVMHLLHDLNHQGVAIVMTTHEINAVAAHLPSVVCLNTRVLAAGPPEEVFTPEILKLTYGADMPVIHHDGLTLVAERPHLRARNARRGPLHDPDTSGHAEDHRA